MHLIDAKQELYGLQRSIDIVITREYSQHSRDHSWNIRDRLRRFLCCGLFWCIIECSEGPDADLGQQRRAHYHPEATTPAGRTGKRYCFQRLYLYSIFAIIDIVRRLPLIVRRPE